MFYTNYTRFTAQKTKVPSRQKFVDVADKRLFAKCAQLSRNGILLTPESFNARRTFLCREEGYLHSRSDKPKADMTKAMMDNQNAMFSSMKNSIAMGVTMMLQMAWVNYFFSGFILAKVPFPLTQKFRGMTQSGVDMENLDVRYVSGLSFYFLVMFGTSQLQSLLVDQKQLMTEDSMQQQQMGEGQGQEQNPMAPGGAPGMMGANPMMAMMGMPGQQGPDAKKLFQTEVDNLMIHYHKFALKDGEKLALARLRGQIN